MREKTFTELNEATQNLGAGHTGTADLLNLLLSRLGEELGHHNDGLLGEAALAEHLEEAGLGDVNHGHDTLGLHLSLGVLLTDGGGHEGPEAVHVDSGAEVVVLLLVEVTHTDLTEEARVVFVHDDAVVVLASCLQTSRHFPVIERSSPC